MNSSYLSALQFTFSITAPVFFILFLGLYLKRTQRINDDFIGISSKLVFNICLPILLFLAIVNSQVNLIAQSKLAIFSGCAAILSFAIFWWIAPLCAKSPEDRGVAVQSAFRSNLAIIGLALCTNAFGDEGLTIGALIIAVVTPLYNILSIYALTRSLYENEKLHWGKLILDIAKNPLILSIALAFVFLYFDWQLPVVLNDTGIYLSKMTLPLALITIGGSLSLSALQKSSVLSSYVVVAKLILLPVAVTMVAWLLDFKNIEIVCLALMFGSPTAAASFVMVKVIGGNHKLASNTVAMSTLVSALTLSVLLYFLRVFNLI
jgi:predicted permease